MPQIEEGCDIGSQRELFVDHYLIDRLDGTSLQLHPPQPAGVAIRYDQPWEDRLAFYTTVLKDENIYRMYYRGSLMGQRPHPTCYAESGDGVHWTKPDLGLVEINGSTQNNAILRHNGQFCVFVDTRPGIPEAERYKANARDQQQPSSLVGYTSADGIRWTKLRDEPIVPMALENNFDSQNVMFWSEVEGCYVLYARHMVSDARIRSTARATSTDFLNWTEQTPMTFSDTGSATPSQHLYTNQTHPYFRAPHIYISLPGRIYFNRSALTEAQSAAVCPDPVSGGGIDISDGVLLTTRAGTTHYDFTFKESFVRPGIGYNNWTSRTNYPALGVVQTGPTEMSLYVQRDYDQQTAHLDRMTLRIDGFASVNAPYTGGEMVTKPFRFSGKELEINYATSAAGSLRIEVQEANGVPVTGYALDECPEIIGDELERSVCWEGGGDVSKLAGTPIRLRFVMKDADLFSLRFR